MPKPCILPAILPSSAARIEPSRLPGEIRLPQASRQLSEFAWQLGCALADGDLGAIDRLGQAAQAGVAALVSERLKWLADSRQSAIVGHLSRLHALLAELAVAFSEQAWWSAGRARQCWLRLAPEIKALCRLMDPLTAELQAAGEALSRCRDALARHEGPLAAALATLDELPAAMAATAGERIETRRYELLAAQMLAADLESLLRADRQNLLVLSDRVRQGVLLQLPGVLLLLGESVQDLNPTRRRLCQDALTKLSQFLE